ncbi:MAG: PhoX family phosphatase [Kiloniellales bacterium]|nr:PhoX family phosphatase [Kiloniellales bacterium]
MRKRDPNPSSSELTYETSEDIAVNPTTNATFGEVVQRRFNRREVLRGSLAVTAMGAIAGPIAFGGRPARADGGKFKFTEIEHGVDETHHVAPGYSADILIRWGDPIFPDAPAFDPRNQTAAAQLKQFGYNNDFIGFLPLPAGSNASDRGLLCVNHEYTNEELMFPGIERQDRDLQFADMTKEMVEVEMAAHGGSVIEVSKAGGKWQVVLDSKYNRRISPYDTATKISGPAAGHPRMQTVQFPSGSDTIGTLNNCAGGMTPWGTYLMAEENFHGYFWGDIAGNPEKANYERYGVPGQWYAWGKYVDRFNLEKDPRAANHFGWVVEVDPLDPSAPPVKRTALGRFKHEGAEPIVNGDGRVVLYSGDDQRFDYLYKFVTEGRYDPANRAANRDLLDKGTLYVARFEDDGSMTWLPLVHGKGPLTAENGFKSQADVAIETRRAADLLGATPMDRPEDVQPNPKSGKVYVMLTNNSKRKAEQVNAANPRAENLFGHIIELTAPGNDHAAEKFSWDFLVKCGDPSVAEIGATWNPKTSKHGWFAAPDNCAFDSQGRLWISTDQGSAWSKSGTADGLFGIETEGDTRGYSKMFFRVPIGAELCGPTFTPDDKTLFLAVQHPASDGTKDFPGFERRSTFDDAATRWPDFKDGVPPRPSVVVVTKDDGGPIAS